MADSKFLEGKVPRIIAHRGLWQHRQDITENTLESFREALIYGATHIETDVQATLDGHAVLFHDSNLSRVSSSSRSVSELNLAELQEIRLLSGGRVPSLIEALDTFPEAKFNLDIKTQSAVEPTVAAIESRNAHHRVLVTSFSNSRRQAALVSLSKPVASSAAALTVLLAWISHHALFGIGLKLLLRDLDALQIPVRSGPLMFADRSFISKISKLGVELHYWTINDPDQISELIERGAQGIVTDRVDLVPPRFLREA